VGFLRLTPGVVCTRHRHQRARRRKKPQETNGTGTSIASSSYGVDWMRDWSSYLHSTVYLGLVNDTVQYDTCEGDRESFGVSINYDIDT